MRNLRLALTVASLAFICTLSSCSLTSLVAGKAIGKFIRSSLQPSETSRDTAKAWSDEIADYPFLKGWRDSLIQTKAIRDTFLTSDDGIRLHALYIKSADSSRVTAIVLHGHTRSSVSVAHLGYMYSHDMGYNVILPDMRMSGLSGGDHYTMGWEERRDVEKWIDLAPHLFSDSTEILIHGVSMGAATAMMVAGDSISERVKWYIEDCGYSSITDEFKYLMNKDYHVDKVSILKTAVKQARKIYKLDFNKVSPEDFIKKCRKPMLFIHGSADTYVPTSMVMKLYDVKPDPKELWIVPGAGHDGSYSKDPKEYEKRIRDFLSRYK